MASSFRILLIVSLATGGLLGQTCRCKVAEAATSTAAPTAVSVCPACADHQPTQPLPRPCRCGDCHANRAATRPQPFTSTSTLQRSLDSVDVAVVLWHCPLDEVGCVQAHGEASRDGPAAPSCSIPILLQQLLI